MEVNSDDKKESKRMWILGETTPSLPTTQLPTKKCVLKVLLHSNENSVQKRVHSVAGDILELWNSHGMYCIDKANISKKLIRLHHEYISLKKNKSRLSQNQKVKTIEFKKKNMKLFDVAHQNFDSLVSSSHIKEFLEDQRTKRIKRLKCIQLAAAPIKQTRSHKITSMEIVAMNDDFNSSSPPDDQKDETWEPPMEKKKRETAQSDGSALVNEIIRSPNVTAAVDRVGVSDESFRMIMGPISAVLKADSAETRLSRSTIKRKRELNRISITNNIKENFISQSSSKKFVVHWDGKLMSDIMNPNYALKKRKVDRIAVAVSGDGESKLLGIPRVRNGTGHLMSLVVLDEIEKWQIKKNVIGMCCDTTSSNTGWKNGACALLETVCLGDELILFPCRHHVYETIVGGVFVQLFGASTGPNIQLFVDFRDIWNDIDTKGSLENLPECNFDSPFTKRLREETIQCLQSLLADESSYIPRGDYKELIDLTLIILGVENPSYNLKVPGGLHQARWMCKIIYTFKIYALRKQLQLSDEFLKTLENFCMFCSLLYVIAWVTCPLLRDATVNDIQLYKNLIAYTHINHEIAHTAIRKLNGQMWYLGPELAAFALFSDKVDVSEKRAMIEKMKKCDGQWQRSLLPKYTNVHQKGITDLVTSRSLFSLNKLDSETFKFMLHNDPSVWETSQEFQQLRHYVSKLNEVNDVAERAIARMTKYNSSLSYSEVEKQRIDSR